MQGLRLLLCVGLVVADSRYERSNFENRTTNVGCVYYFHIVRLFCLMCGSKL